MPLSSGLLVTAAHALSVHSRPPTGPPFSAFGANDSVLSHMSLCPAHHIRSLSTLLASCGHGVIRLGHWRSALSGCKPNVCHCHCSFYLAVALYGCFRPPITISPPLEEPSPRCQCPSGRAAEWGTSGWPLPPPRSARVFVCALLCVVCCLLDCLCPLGSPTALRLLCCRVQPMPPFSLSASDCLQFSAPLTPLSWTQKQCCLMNVLLSLLVWAPSFSACVASLTLFALSALFEFFKAEIFSAHFRHNVQMLFPFACFAARMNGSR